MPNSKPLDNSDELPARNVFSPELIYMAVALSFLLHVLISTNELPLEAAIIEIASSAFARKSSISAFFALS